MAMCGRYQFTLNQCPEVIKIIQEVERRHGTGSWNPGEIRPTVKAPVLLAAGQRIHPELQVWGYRLPKSLVINARAESVEKKTLFRDSIVSRRCVIPSTGFFEWDAGKRKYLFNLPGESVLYMAGLYMLQNGQPCYCILTTEANASMQDVHPRMPLVLKREQVALWLGEREEARKLLHMTPPLLEKSAEDAQLQLW